MHNLTFSGKMYLKKSDDERSILIGNILYPKFSIREIVVSIILLSVFIVIILAQINCDKYVARMILYLFDT